MNDGPGRALDEQARARFIRLGGVAVLLGLAIHIVVNWLVKELPADDLAGAELRSYLAEQAGPWAIVHGARYVAFACLVLFAAGLYSRTCQHRGPAPQGWGVVGLLGAALLVTTGSLANGLETLAYLDLDLLRNNQELFWLLRNTTRTLFTGEMVAWAVIIFGFSMAGWRSRTLPRWLVYLGWLDAATALLVGVFIVDVLRGGWATIFATSTSLLGMVWFGGIGVVMLLRGAD